MPVENKNDVYAINVDKISLDEVEVITIEETTICRLLANVLGYLTMFAIVFMLFYLFIFELISFVMWEND